MHELHDDEDAVETVEFDDRAPVVASVVFGLTISWMVVFGQVDSVICLTRGESSMKASVFLRSSKVNEQLEFAVGVWGAFP